MFNEILLERVNRLTDVRLSERRKQVPIEILKIKQDGNARGMLNSSTTILPIKDLCEREIEIRAIITWQSLVRVISTLGYESKATLGNDLKEYLFSKINSNYEELTQVLNQNLGNIMRPEQVQMDEARNHALAKHEIEIDLYVDSLKDLVKENQPVIEPSHNYNFYGNVGSVQTGLSAQANVIQNIGSEDHDAIKQALALATQAITAATNIAEAQKKELTEIANQAEKELSKAEPNSILLQSMFVTIGTAIQTLASAKPAYLALKGALIPLGITLP